MGTKSIRNAMTPRDRPTTARITRLPLRLCTLCAFALNRLAVRRPRLPAPAALRLGEGVAAQVLRGGIDLMFGSGRK